MKLLTKILPGAKAAALAAGLAISGAAAQSQTVEEFYTGQTLTFIVSASTGGGADFYGRHLAPYLVKHLPGNPDVVVQNVPGAGGMVAAIQLMNTLPDDGTTIALLQRNNLYRPLVAEDEIQFDAREVYWIGSINKEQFVLLARTDADVQTAEDVFTTPLTIGATGPANENRTLARMMNEYFGAQLNIIPGYDGTEALRLAMERDEIQGRMQAISALKFGADYELLQSGHMGVVIQVLAQQHPDFPDAPALMAFSDDPEAMALARFMLAPLEAGRPVAVPGNVPQDRVDALRAAFDAAVADPQFLAEIEEANSEVDAISGLEIQAIVGELYATPPDLLTKIRTLLAPE